MRNYLLVFCLLVSSSCAATRDVEANYRPIETMSERPWYASFLGGENTITTVGDTVYVEDLDDYMAKRPAGSPRYDSVMLHEKVHSYRQHQIGVSLWLSKYLSSRSFRWEEESLGWYVQLRMYRRYGLQVIPEGVAKTLSKYVDYDEALIWTQDVLSGRWHPEDGALPPDVDIN